MSAFRISLLASCVLLAAGALRAELPPEAQSAMKKGVIAGQQQDYPLALRYFEEAHQAAPDASEIYFNLGLTESKIPGRELRAMAWFGAYLAANPATPSAGAIRDQLDVLEVKAQSNIARLLQVTQEAASKLHDKPDDYGSKWQKLDYVGRLYAESGDIDAARKIATLLKGHNDHVASIQTSILQAQVKGGNVAGARKTLEAIRLDDADIYDLFAIARAQRKSGDQAGATKTVARASKKAGQMDGGEEGAGIVSPWARRSEMLQRVIEVQIEIGDPAGVEKTLALFERNARSDYMRAPGLALVALEYARAGNEARAKKFLRETQQLIPAIVSNEWIKDYRTNLMSIILTSVAETLARLGDRDTSTATLVSLRKLIDSVKDASSKCWALLTMAKSQIEQSDLAGARETLDAVQVVMDGIRDPSRTSSLRLRTVRIALLAKLGVTELPAEPAAHWLANLNDDNQYGDCALKAAPFLDLGAYLKSLPADNADQLFEGMETAARQMVEAQNTIQKMLREQVKQQPIPNA